MRKLDLQLFAGGHSVTVYRDGGASAFAASSDSDVQKNADVTLSMTISSGYELDEIEVVAGGVTITKTGSVYGFKMGEANVVLYLKTKKSNLYRVTEQCTVWVNDAKTVLNKNVEVILTQQGGIADVRATPQEITVNDVVQGLIDQGILVKV